jgi:hypothetical protein
MKNSRLKIKSVLIELLFCFAYFLIGALISVFETVILFSIFDFSIEGRLILTWINRGIIISIAIVFLLSYIIPKFKKSLHSRNDFLFLYIEIIVILFSTIYWYFWLQIK